MTDSPIIGILTQPLSNGGRYDSFIEASHVKFLQGAGARVVKVDYKNSRTTMKNRLSHLDAIYIPGDSRSVLSSYQYRKAVGNILNWAYSVNTDQRDPRHFPVVAVSYGLGVVLQAVSKNTGVLSNIPATL